MGKLSRINTGDQFGRLTVIGRVEDAVNKTDGKHSSRFLCKCSCKNMTTIIVRGKNLVSGDTKSCGCILRETASLLKSKNPMKPDSPYIAVYGNMRVIGAYHTMMYESKHSYASVCGAWMESGSTSIKNFYDDMSPTYQEGYKIARLDPEIGFRPNNCYWEDRSGNMNQYQLSNKFICIDGNNYTASEWNMALGYPVNTIRDRLISGYTDEDAVFGKDSDKQIISSNAVYFVNEYGRPLNNQYVNEFILSKQG